VKAYRDDEDLTKSEPDSRCRVRMERSAKLLLTDKACRTAWRFLERSFCRFQEIPAVPQPSPRLPSFRDPQFTLNFSSRLIFAARPSTLV
jgi:hypothetical protein